MFKIFHKIGIVVVDKLLSLEKEDEILKNAVYLHLLFTFNLLPGFNK